MTHARRFARTTTLLGSLLLGGTALAQTPLIYPGQLFEDFSFPRPNTDCSSSNSANTLVHELTFIVDTTGPYRIYSQQNFDGVIYVYDRNIDPQQPTLGCLAGNDDRFGIIGRSEIPSITLEANVVYNVVTAGFSSQSIGTFTNAIEGPGNVSRPSTSVITGSTVDQPRFDRANENCTARDPNATNTAYQDQIFRVEVSGDYSIRTRFDVDAPFDGFISLYEGSFNPLDPVSGCVVGDDDGPDGTLDAQIESVTLLAGRSYHLVTSSFDNTETGQFSTRIDGPGGVLLEAGFYTPEAITGLWFDPSLDGSGFNVLSSDAGIIITFYGYIAGEQRWLISELLPADFQPVQQVQLRMLIGETGQINNPTPGSQLDEFGSLTLRLFDCASGEATLAGSGSFAGVTQDYALTRLLKGSGNDCP